MKKTIENRINNKIVIGPKRVWKRKIPENYQTLLKEQKEITEQLEKEKINYLPFILRQKLFISVGKKDYNTAKQLIENYYQNQ